jgi:ABC-type glycerol-3-phosphate transport system substrate-binding protein
MKITPLSAILTTVAVLASTFAVAGCGGKTASSSTATPDTPATTTSTSPTTHKHKSKPAY